MVIMRYRIKVKFVLENPWYQCTERLIEQEDFDTNIKVLNSMLKSGEITSYEVQMEGH